MKEKYDPKQYWKEKLEFDSNEELLIYHYLCGNIKKREIKKIDSAKRFNEYKLWKKHVEKIIQKCDNEELLEFYHFIRLSSRLCNNIMGLHTNFALPLVVSIIASWFIPKLLDTVFYSNLQMQHSSVLENIILFVIYFFVITIFFFLAACFFIYFLRDYINSKRESVFWEDYLEIIEEEINNQNLKK